MQPNINANNIAMPGDHAAFVKSFFLASDNPTDHVGYAENFTADAILKMGLKTAVGKDRKASLDCVPREVSGQKLTATQRSWR